MRPCHHSISKCIKIFLVYVLFRTQRSTHLNLYPFNANFTTLIPYFLCTMHQISLCTDFSVCVQSVAFTMVTQCAYGSWVIILNSLNRCKIEKSRLCVLIQKLFSLSRWTCFLNKGFLIMYSQCMALIYFVNTENKRDNSLLFYTKTSSFKKPFGFHIFSSTKNPVSSLCCKLLIFTE